MSDDEKRIKELFGRTREILARINSPTLKILRQVAEAQRRLAADPGIKAASKAMAQLASSPALGHALKAAQATQSMQPSKVVPRELPSAARVPEHEAPTPYIPARLDTSPDSLLVQQQRIFIALVQTRALFHDCQQVMKLNQGSYTAIAPHIVLAAFEFPVEEIDEEVNLHAEAFVRAMIAGANG